MGPGLDRHFCWGNLLMLEIILALYMFMAILIATVKFDYLGIAC
jgi:hypothetical protein